MLFRLNPDDPGDVSEVRSTTLAEAGWREVHLENLIVENIDRVLRADDLMVVSQEIQFQEEPDIMALDRHGHLYMFELKRWTSSQENLLQILRYGQRFGPCGYDTLEYLWTRYQSKLGGPGTSLEEAHARYFELTDPLDERSFNAKQRYVVHHGWIGSGHKKRDRVLEPEWYSGLRPTLQSLPHPRRSSVLGVETIRGPGSRL